MYVFIQATRHYKKQTEQTAIINDSISYKILLTTPQLITSTRNGNMISLLSEVKGNLYVCCHANYATGEKCNIEGYFNTTHLILNKNFL